MTVAGDRDRQQRVLTQADFDRFAALSGDDNPIHVDPAFAATTAFRVPVAHGMLLYSLVAAGLRRLRPEAVTLRQELMFPAPTPVGATVTVTVAVEGTGARGVEVATTVTHDDGVGLRGSCLLAADWPEPATAPADAGSAPPPAGDCDPPDPGDERWWDRAVGRCATTRRRFTRHDLADYRELTGDDVPDDAVPGPLVAGMFSHLLGVELPGRGTNYLKQSLAWRRAVPLDRDLAATVTVTGVRPGRRLVDLATTCGPVDADPDCTGRALVLARGVVPPGRATTR